jgi:hypothetical protein
LPSGGRSQGWKYVVAPNLDWAQNMYRLLDYLARKGTGNLCLAIGNCHRAMGV